MLSRFAITSTIRPKLFDLHGIAPNGIAPRGIAPTFLRPARDCAQHGIAPKYLNYDCTDDLHGIAPNGIAPRGIAPTFLRPARDCAQRNCAQRDCAQHGIAPNMGLRPTRDCAHHGIAPKYLNYDCTDWYSIHGIVPNTGLHLIIAGILATILTSLA